MDKKAFKEKKKNYDIEYLKNNYKRVPLNLKKELYQDLKEYCSFNSIGVQTLIIELIKNKIYK